MAESFNEVLNAAVRDFEEHGYDDEARLARWQDRLRRAAEGSTRSLAQAQQDLRQALLTIYARSVERGEMLRRHPGVSRFTLQRVQPQLRAILDRRILASADLIRLHRTEAIETTLRRFAGWSTSVPAGGSRTVDVPEVKLNVRKPLQQLPFVQRRLNIDQGQKLVGAINETLAEGAGAIAGVWHSHWKQPGYNYREDHRERDQVVFLLTDSWAKTAGYVKPGPGGLYRDVTKVGEEPYCRCFMRWIYNLRDLPPEMLTAAGATALADARARISA